MGNTPDFSALTTLTSTATAAISSLSTATLGIIGASLTLTVLGVAWAILRKNIKKGS